MDRPETEFRRMEDALFQTPNPAQIAIIDRGVETSYARLQEHVQGFATKLLSEGAGPGDRVAIYLDKSLESVVALFGIWRTGAIAVPIHPVLKARQVEYIVEDSGAARLVSDRRKLSRLRADADRLPPTLEVDLAPEGDGGGHSETSDEHAVLGAAQDALGSEERAAILYTSGSTGRPKGILLSHQNLLAGARIVAQYLEITDRDRILSVTPFSFDYGLNQLLSAILCNATLVLARSNFPPDICQLLEDHEITGLAAVPPLWIQLRGRMSPFPTKSFPHLRYMTNTGGVLPEDIIQAYRSQLPHTKIVLMYGLSEAFRSTYLPPEQLAGRPTSMGQAIPETTLYVVDEDGNEVPPDTLGELVHRGPTVALGYWQNPEATAKAFRPDPVRKDGEIVVFSGDRVRRDAEGYFFFAGRSDQMLKCQGYRLSPEEVEEHLFESGLLREVVVVGRPDPEAGQRIVAHLVAGPDYTEKAFLLYCRQHMPSHMVPSEIVVHEALPRTPSGKFDRKQLAS